ncbi:MAG TPA: L,D-transpeptidase family protein [Pseudobdellovibrionaceae bacterium]
MESFCKLTFTLVLFIFFLILPPVFAQESLGLSYNTVIDALSLDEMRAAVFRIQEHGLNPRNYWSEGMDGQYQKGEYEQLKPLANQTFLRLLADISLGTIDPEKLSPDIKLTRKKFLTPDRLRALIVSTGQKPELLIAALAPQNTLYEALKHSLAKVYPACQNGKWVKLTPSKKILKLGVKSPAVIPLKKYFTFLGYQISNLDDVVDQETVRAINDIEWTLHLKPDGKLRSSGKVWKFLNTPCMDRVHQLQADMEKIRWFPRQFEDRYIFINLAMTYLVMVDKSQNPPYIMSFRTINGRVERKSPTMKDRVVRVILNPFWVVPPTIFVEDKVKEIRHLSRRQVSEYFNSHNYEVWNKSFTKRLNPNSINWWALNTSLDSEIYIRQKPHYMNALGVIKFELTNSFSVYLHDTNQRELFLDPQRLVSSGCIRVEKPLDLAEYLLKNSGWDRTKIESVIAKPGQVMKTETPVIVQNPIAVYTMFLTSFLSSDGVLRFAEDAYEQNKTILKTLQRL